MRKSVRDGVEDFLSGRRAMLHERWSYSDDMDDAMDYVFDEIAGAIQGGKAQVHDIGNGIALYKGSVPVSLFGIDGITLNFYLYDTPSDDACIYVHDNAERENHYDEGGRELTLTIYTVFGEMAEWLCRKNVSHELEHVLQVSKGHAGNANYRSLMDDIYYRACSVIRQYGNSDESIPVVVARLIYYSNPHEQDAFMNEYYQDLKFMRQLVHDGKSEAHARYDDYCRKYRIVCSKRNSAELSAELKRYGIYGMSEGNFFLMLEKGIKRFKKKMGNIEKHFKEYSKSRNESLCRPMPSKNGTLINFLYR